MIPGMYMHFGLEQARSDDYDTGVYNVKYFLASKFYKLIVSSSQTKNIALHFVYIADNAYIKITHHSGPKLRVAVISLRTLYLR